MISLVLLLATADPELVSLRYQMSRASWSTCIDYQMEKTQASLVGPEVSKAALVRLAMEKCYVFGQDVKRTLPDSVTRHLNDQGVKYFSQGVVDSLVESSFKIAEDEMRREKEGL